MQWSCPWFCKERPPFVAVVRYTFGRKPMDKSVGQARWLLAVIFAMPITLMAIAIAFG